MPEWGLDLWACGYGIVAWCGAVACGLWACQPVSWCGMTLAIRHNKRGKELGASGIHGEGAISAQEGGGY